MSVNEQVEQWLAAEVDDRDSAELRALLAAGDDAARAALAERFAAPLQFGTAGLRGPVRAGPNGMNRAVVRRTAAGLADWLRAGGNAGGPVVIGYDARHRSADFARDSAAVFAAAGFDARLLPGPLPTPVLAFAVQRLGAVAGVMVTASHNPPQDNGYKVYLADGAQLAPPADAEIEARIHAAPPAAAVPVADTYAVLGDEVRDAYVEAVAALADHGGPRGLTIVHTALHGVGDGTLRAVFAAAGFPAPIGVPAQARPDADFPTVAFPNPEEPGALDLALDLARERGADLVLANDPDADRCAVAVPGPDGAWRMLTGDQVGGLLGDALLRKGVRGTVATTIVSSSLLGVIAQGYGAGYVETLTGFKWISRAAPDLVYGYEEALGYCVAPDLVRDKDGIAAALLVAELAAGLKANGESLLTRLAEIDAAYGRHDTGQISIRVDDVRQIGELMARLRRRPPASLLGQPAQVEDLLPDADVLRVRADGVRVVVRPSGTEPKLKAYLETSGASDGRLADLRAEVGRLLEAAQAPA